MDKLPRTPTGKIEKHEILAALAGVPLWDRSAPPAG
jgi:acyl-coenzyme A synthetase/AMP-(fatty) acid ligase